MTILNLKVSKIWCKEMSTIFSKFFFKCIAQDCNTFSFAYNALALTEGGGSNMVHNRHILTKGI